MDGTRDIGWKQFAISILDMIRWPAAIVIIVFILRESLEQVLLAIAGAVRG
ncbi:MAG TPA: hypothetical protein VFQ57_05430 [Sphingomonas sp.]|jgi:uncharacterized membrane-anchored protein|nr:hypothetical protein [Sphingomonas sp.]